MRRVYKNLFPAKISASIMAANMWKNSLRNVESDNNKILYQILLDFFYSETVLTYGISLICCTVWKQHKKKKRSKQYLLYLVRTHFLTEFFEGFTPNLPSCLF